VEKAKTKARKHDPAAQILQPVDYTGLAARLAALGEGESDQIALMATIACEIYRADDRFDWVGFYRAVGNDTLKIGPYQGGHGCLTIPYTRGVCGAAARSGQVQIVADVAAVVDHIACATSTRSEIVIPFFDPQGELIGVLDIDSDRADAFHARDGEGLAEILQVAFGGRH